MKWTHAALFLLGLGAQAAAAPVEFRAKPTVERQGRRATVRFALAASADVEVAILDQEGGVVRHLAAGVLGGKNPPPAPLQLGLAQKIDWDGNDDYGQAVADAAACSVRVRAGMGVKLERMVGGDPYAFYSLEMGQGDHAAWRITGLEAKPDGSVYVLGNANNYGPPALRRYDADGHYRATVFPPPAGKPLADMMGWGLYPGKDDSYALRYSDLNSPVLSTTIMAGTRGQIATLIPSPSQDQLLITRNQQLLTVHTDGTIPPRPPAGLLVNDPATAADAKNPKLGAWELTGPLHTCFAPDGRHFYLSGVFAGTLVKGVRVGAEPTGFWRDGQVFKVDAATRKATAWFALDVKKVITDLAARGQSPIADARYGTYAALQGVAVDAAGRVFVCDRQNQRILVLDDTAKVIRAIPLAYPDAIAVSRKSKALFVTTRTGHYHAKGDLKLLKFSDWSKDTAPATVLPLCEVRQYDQRTHLAVAQSPEGDDLVWVAYTALPVRIYRDRGAELELVKDFYQAGTQRALDLQHMVVDPKTENLYVADGFDHCFRISDWNDPQFVPCLTAQNTPLKALGLAIDARNRWLYGRADRSAVARYQLDGAYHTPAPLMGKDNVFTPVLSNNWAIGLGHGDRGMAAAPDGSLATLGALGGGPDYSGYLRFFAADAAMAPWKGLLFKSFGEKVRAAGVRFDLAGNLYAGKSDGVPQSTPPGYENDVHFSQSTGRIYKYTPTGSRGGNLFPTAPATPAKVYDVHYGAIATQFTRTPRFGVDGYGRIYYPTSLMARVSVIDNEGNPVLDFGSYGNRDATGSAGSIPLAWPSSVDATDDCIYVSDIVNIRLLRLAKQFATSITVKIE